MNTSSRFQFGRYELDSGTFKLLRDGVPVALEPKGIDLLRLLLERAPRVVEKQEIFAIVWKDVAVTDNALTRLVTHIRKVLDDDARTPRYIETIATRGYRFVSLSRVSTVKSRFSAHEQLLCRPSKFPNRQRQHDRDRSGCRTSSPARWFFSPPLHCSAPAWSAGPVRRHG
jgi:DNA-binding winged helix-turn-helix (wHTH) protein